MKYMNKHIYTMLEKLKDKSDKKTGKKLQPIPVQITYLSSKKSENIQNEVLTYTSENPYSEDKFKRKSQDNFSPCYKVFEQP